MGAVAAAAGLTIDFRKGQSRSGKSWKTLENACFPRKGNLANDSGCRSHNFRSINRSGKSWKTLENGCFPRKGAIWRATAAAGRTISERWRGRAGRPPRPPSRPRAGSPSAPVLGCTRRTRTRGAKRKRRWRFGPGGGVVQNSAIIKREKGGGGLDQEVG